MTCEHFHPNQIKRWVATEKDHDRLISVEEGFDLNRKRRPGNVIVMGATAAIDRRGRRWEPDLKLAPVRDTACSWFEYDCARMIGATRLSAQSEAFLRALAKITRRMPTPDEVRFFTAKSTSLDAMRNALVEKGGRQS